MLIERLRDVQKEGTMFHYCSAQTFLSIIQNRTVRFSYVNLLNDAEEGRWGYDIFIEAVNLLLRREGIYKNAPAVPRAFLDKIDQVWFNSQIGFSNFVACFSSDGDSLSQWRAYADDGRGFAIGFKVKELRRMPIQIYDVLYEKEKQVEEMVNILGASYLEFQEREMKLDDGWLFQRSVEIAASSIALKNPAWRDEKEVRCHHIVSSIVDRASWRLVDDGGLIDGTSVAGQPIQFQARDGVVVPFFDMPFEVSAECQPIQEVVLGPKYLHAPYTVRFALGNAGYGDVPIKNAGSKYR
jgi:hypothetical protein